MNLVDQAAGLAAIFNQRQKNVGLAGVTDGLGAVTDDVIAALKFSTDPLAIAKQFWAQVQGRSWDQAISSANARAASGQWIAKDLASKNDLITLLVSSAINAKIAADNGNLETSNDLNRTWYVIAQKMGIGTPSATQIDQMKSKSTGNIEVLVPVLIAAVIVQALAVTAIVVALIYIASQVIDDVLSKIVCDRELVRLHADYNKIVDRHNADPNMTWSQDDKDARDKLIESQKFVAAGCTKPKPGIEAWPWGWWVLGGTVLTTGVLGVVYRKEIGSWIERKRLHG